MHALNAYLGSSVYSEDMFARELAAFDAAQRARYKDVVSAAAFDAVYADQRNIISHALAKLGVYVRYVPLGQATSALRDMPPEVDAFFVFNSDHIWLMRRREGEWFKVDSIGGVSRMPISSLAHEQVGLMVPVTDMFAEFMRLCERLDVLVGCDPEGYLERMHAERKNIGDVEVIIGSTVALLETKEEMPSRPGCAQSAFGTLVRETIDSYDRFAREYTGGNIGRLAYVLSYVPGIIRQIWCIRARSLPLMRASS
jgi:hypothetical protein